MLYPTELRAHSAIDSKSFVDADEMIFQASLGGVLTLICPVARQAPEKENRVDTKSLESYTYICSASYLFYFIGSLEHFDTEAWDRSVPPMLAEASVHARRESVLYCKP
jgi:hypothetical protein